MRGLFLGWIVGCTVVIVGCYGISLVAINQSNEAGEVGGDAAGPHASSSEDADGTAASAAGAPRVPTPPLSEPQMPAGQASQPLVPTLPADDDPPEPEDAGPDEAGTGGPDDAGVNRAEGDPPEGDDATPPDDGGDAQEPGGDDGTGTGTPDGTGEGDDPPPPSPDPYSFAAAVYEFPAAPPESPHTKFFKVPEGHDELTLRVRLVKDESSPVVVTTLLNVRLWTPALDTALTCAPPEPTVTEDVLECSKVAPATPGDWKITYDGAGALTGYVYADAP